MVNRNKYGREEMLRINGNTESDHLVASEFCTSTLIQARACYIIVCDIRDLKVWLDKTSVQGARDAIATLRQIGIVVSELSKFHRSGNLGDALYNLMQEVSKISAEAESIYMQIVEIYPSDSDYMKITELGETHSPDVSGAPGTPGNVNNGPR